LDKKINELKKLKYETQIQGTTQVQQQISEEEKIKNECNDYLKGTGLNI